MLSKLFAGRRRVIGLAATAALVTAPALATAAATTPALAMGSPPGRAIPHSKPSWLAHARDLGAAPASARVSARVYLAPNGGMAALQDEALAVSTPGNAEYGKFLTSQQYFERFGTRSATVAQVRQWLTGAGFRVVSVAAHNRYISVSGTATAAERAFGTKINRYRHDGLSVQAPSSQLTVPAALASSVLAVTGVDTTPSVVHPAQGTSPAPPPAGFRNAPPCSAFYGEKSATTLPQFNGATLPYAPCGYVGSQFRSAYEVSTTLTGAGVTVAITDAYAAPTIASDASTYASRHVAHRAGTAKKLSRPRPCTRWPRARKSATTRRPVASTATSSTRSLGLTTRASRRSSPTRGAGSRWAQAPRSSPHWSRRSCRARPRESATLSLPATRVTRSRIRGRGRPTTRHPTRT